MFQVGITPDFDRNAKGLIDPVLAEQFDGVPGLIMNDLRKPGRRRHRSSCGMPTR